MVGHVDSAKVHQCFSWVHSSLGNGSREPGPTAPRVRSGIGAAGTRRLLSHSSTASNKLLIS